MYMFLKFIKNLPKPLVIFLAASLIIFVVSGVVYWKNFNSPNKTSIAQTNNNADSSSKLNSSEKNTSNSSSSESASSISSNASSNVLSSVTANKVGSNQSSIIQTHEITLVGTLCGVLNMPYYSPEPNKSNYSVYNSYCTVLDDGQEVGKIYFNQQTSGLDNLVSIRNNGDISLREGGVSHVEKMLKTSNEQYFRWLPGFQSFGGMVYKYDFATGKLSFVETIYFESFRPNYPGANLNDIVKGYQTPECLQYDTAKAWEYSCFRILTCCDINQNHGERIGLTDYEKAEIDRVKASYFNYKTKGPIYGLPMDQFEASISWPNI